MGVFKSKPVAANANVTSHDRAVLELKVQRDKLYAAQKRISSVIEKETSVARALLAKGQKERAKLCLQRKRMQEVHLAKVSGMTYNLVVMIEATEFAKVEKEVFATLKLATKALQDLNKHMSVEVVDRLMGDAEDALAAQQEVSEALAAQLGDADADASDEELAGLEAAALRVPTGPIHISPPQGVVLPDVPTGPIGVVVAPEPERKEAAMN